MEVRVELHTSADLLLRIKEAGRAPELGSTEKFIAPTVDP
jgi:hypothetical protein